MKKLKSLALLAFGAAMVLTGCGEAAPTTTSGQGETTTNTGAGPVDENTYVSSVDFSDEDPASEFSPELVCSMSVVHIETTLKIEGDKYTLTKVEHGREQDQADMINQDLAFTNYKAYYEYSYSGKVTGGNGTYNLEAPTSGTVFGYYEQNVHKLYPARFPFRATCVLPDDRDWSKVNTEPVALTEKQYEFKYFGNLWIETGSEYRNQIAKVADGKISSITADTNAQAIEVNEFKEDEDEGGEEEGKEIEDSLLTLHTEGNDCYLYFRENNVLTFEYRAMSVFEDGTYSYGTQGLTVTPLDGATCTVELKGDDYEISYVAKAGGGRLTDTWTISKDDVHKALNPGLILTNGGFSFIIKPNGKYEFTFASYGISETGTYSWENDMIDFTPDEKYSKAVVEVTYDENEVTISYIAHTSSQINTSFTTTADALLEYKVLGDLQLVSNNYLLTIKVDGTYEFEFTTYGIKESGTYAFVDNQIALTPDTDYSNAVVDVNYGEEEVSIVYTAHKNAQIKATFTTTAEALAQYYKLTDLKLVNNNYIFTIKVDGTYDFEFTSYGIKESGSYTFVENKIVFTPAEKYNKAVVNAEYADPAVNINYTAHTSSQIQTVFETTVAAVSQFIK